jgi:hypothetical protein
LEDLGLDGMIILKRVLKKYDGRMCTAFVLFRAVGSYEPNYEPSASIKI